ncbi:MAG: metal ABC transporter solute-binding protein, Zn/Mn family [Acidimicrobiales bacterium]
MRTVLRICVVAATLAALTSCGGNDGASDAGGGAQIVVTTNILGDVVQELVGDDADVQVIMPPGSDPHDFAPSAQQAAALRDAHVVVVNGLGFEAGLVDTIDAAKEDGVQVVTATDAVDLLPLPAPGGGDDPHFFTDPVRMHAAAEHIADELARLVQGLDTLAFQDRVDAYLADLDQLDAQVEDVLAAVPDDRRTLVTNHEVFGYFADRYGFEVLGAIVPGGTTLAEPSAADLAALAGQIEAAGVPAIFAETSSPNRLADALAAEGTDVEVVDLFSESLGEAGGDGATYLDMVRTNAERIAAALR